jgi:selenium metabolism protein YedF
MKIMIKVDALGEACPIPVIKTKNAIKGITGAETVEVLVDNDIAVSNVTKFGTNEGGEVTSEKIGDSEYKITIKLNGGEKVEEEVIEVAKSGNGTVVFIGSDKMGEGAEELGHTLIKGFIFAITQLDELPTKVLFYNKGAYLTTEGSESIEDLKKLVEAGVEVATCGLCMDYYGLKEKLAVGTVTNMYSIVEALSVADRVIRP